jgi:hypothetical protein
MTKSKSSFNHTIILGQEGYGKIDLLSVKCRICEDNS